MSVHTRFGEVARRIATVTSVVRTRGEDEFRSEVSGGPNGTLDHRAEAAVQRLEKVAERLEASIS